MRRRTPRLPRYGASPSTIHVRSDGDGSAATRVRAAAIQSGPGPGLQDGYGDAFGAVGGSPLGSRRHSGVSLRARGGGRSLHPGDRAGRVFTLPTMEHLQETTRCGEGRPSLLLGASIGGRHVGRVHVEVTATSVVNINDVLDSPARGALCRSVVSERLVRVRPRHPPHAIKASGGSRARTSSESPMS